MGRLGRQRLLFVVPAVVAFAIATAACGGSPKAGVASVGTTTTAAPAGAAANGGPSSDGDRVRELVQFATCVRSRGVLNFPAPGSPSSAMRTFKQSGAMSSPEFQAAATGLCEIRPTGRSAPANHHPGPGRLLEGDRLHATPRHRGLPRPGLLG